MSPSPKAWTAPLRLTRPTARGPALHGCYHQTPQPKSHFPLKFPSVFFGVVSIPVLPVAQTQKLCIISNYLRTCHDSQLSYFPRPPSSSTSLPRSLSSPHTDTAHLSAPFSLSYIRVLYYSGVSPLPMSFRLPCHFWPNQSLLKNFSTSLIPRNQNPIFTSCHARSP